MRQYAFLSGVWQTRREKARSPGPSQAQLHIKCHLATTISIHCQLHQTPRTGELTKVSGLEPHGNTADAIIYIYMCILYIYIYCKWGLYGDTAYINPQYFKGLSANALLAQVPISRKTSRSSVAAIETLENTNARCS